MFLLAGADVRAPKPATAPARAHPRRSLDCARDDDAPSLNPLPRGRRGDRTQPGGGTGLDTSPATRGRSVSKANREGSGGSRPSVIPTGAKRREGGHYSPSGTGFARPDPPRLDEGERRVRHFAPPGGSDRARWPVPLSPSPNRGGRGSGARGSGTRGL